LWAIIWIILLLPLVQSMTNFLHEDTLGGFAPSTVAPEFSKDAWFSGEYQTQMDKRIGETFGLRSWSIRLNNQLVFSVFRKPQANDVVIGKENYLYEGQYIRAYYGDDFVGEDSILHRMERLKFLKDTLTKMNKTLMLVFAPGKVSYYPEYIPDEYKKERKITNEEVHKKYAKQFGLDYIDFNEDFKKKKSKYKQLLYPQHGIHWSIYGSAIAADSIIHRIERIRNIDMPDLYWKDSETIYEQSKWRDYDIAEAMNLMFRFHSEPMAYPNIKYESDSGKTKPSILVISDSFYWTIYEMGFANAFSKADFWFYNEQAYPANANINTLSLKDEIAKHDIILIMGTEATLPRFGWKFIENSYNMFKNIGQQDNEKFKKEVDEFKEFIRNNADFLKGAQERALKANISLDSSITLDAIWEVKKRY
jgi:hypothetical protein